MRLINYAMTLICLFPSIAAAETWLARGVKTLGADIGYIVTAPTRLDRSSGTRLAGLLTVGGGLVYTLDSQFGVATQPNDDDARLEVPDVLVGPGSAYDRIGSTHFAASGAAALVVAGLATGNDRLLVTAGRAVEAMIITKALSSFSKRLIGRGRPFTDEGPRRFEPLNLGNPRDLRSMPSGHTSSAFALATVVANRHRHPLVRYGAYAWATSVALQRVESRSHWVSDTLIGGALGYAVGRAVLRNEVGDHSLTFTPSLNRDSVSGNLQYAF